MNGLVDTKNEYIEHLQDILSIPIAKKIYEIYNECLKNNKSLKEFQTELMEIKKWNNNIVKEEYKKILKATKCKYFDNLIKIIIITSVKIKIYEYKDYFDNIKIKIPDPEDFVHKCYINVSLYCWKNAYLFNKKNIRDSELQNNLNIIEENVRYIIKKTFRDFIPINDILEQIQKNLTNNVEQFSETPKKTKKENNSKKEEQKDVSDDSSENESEEQDESNESRDDSEESRDDSDESDESDESGDESEGSEKSDESEGSGEESKESKESEEQEESKEKINNIIYNSRNDSEDELFKKNILDEKNIIEEEKNIIKEEKNIIEEFTKEESYYINTEKEEIYNEESLSQDTIKDNEIKQENNQSNINNDDFIISIEEKEDYNINDNDINEFINNFESKEDDTFNDDNIKHVSIEMPILKPKRLTFF